MITTQCIQRQYPDSRGVNKLISAALVSREFQRVLLKDPLLAAEMGYRGEKFNLSAQELTWISSIRADNLKHFTEQLMGQMVQVGIGLPAKANFVVSR